MRMSDGMKDFVVGFPIALFLGAVIVWLVSTLGPAAIFLIVGLVISGFVGILIGNFLRDNLRIWK